VHFGSYAAAVEARLAGVAALATLISLGRCAVTHQLSLEPARGSRPAITPSNLHKRRFRSYAAPA